MIKTKKIYKLSATRGGEMDGFGTTVFGYFSAKEDAKKFRQLRQKDIIKNKDESRDGYFDDDWDIEEIEVYDKMIEENEQ